MNEGWNVVLRNDELFNSVNLWLIHKSRDGSEIIVNPIDLALTTNLTPGLEAPEPTIRFHGPDSRQFLQGLADGLAAAGFIPDELKASDKELTATHKHLEDMRSLVAAKLNVQL